MRKGRFLFWLISFILCAFIITTYKKKENEIPYEERIPINVYCAEEFQKDIKEVIEESSLGETNRVVFTESKQNAEFILTDKITKADQGYEKIAWTPLVIAIDNTTKNKIKSYTEEGYLTEAQDGCYTIHFDRIIDDTIKGEWKDKIFCPKQDTREGELFFDFLLININGGRYPKNEEEIQQCTEKANQFLNSTVVIEQDVKEKLENKKVVENEIYILFEDDIYKLISNSTTNYDISYPSNTILYEWYWKFSGKNSEELKNSMYEAGFGNSYNHIEDIMFYEGKLRMDKHRGCRANRIISDSDGFSYVDIPIKEE